MIFSLYVTDGKTGVKVPVDMYDSTQEDLKSTKIPPKWQTNWTSRFIRESDFDLYSLKTEDGELVALGAYEICVSTVVVHIAYMESQPQSNPTVSVEPKYINVGRALIAFGIKLSIDLGFHGDVTLDAKTSELEEHYVKDFRAIRLPGGDRNEAPRMLICDDASRSIFRLYLKGEEV